MTHDAASRLGLGAVAPPFCGEMQTGALVVIAEDSQCRAGREAGLQSESPPCGRARRFDWNLLPGKSGRFFVCPRSRFW